MKKLAAMEKKWINIILLIALGVIAVVVIADYLSTRPGKRPPNPFAFDISEYESADESQISHRETRQIKITDAEAVHIASLNKQIYLLTTDYLQVITPQGQEVRSFALEQTPNSLFVSSDSVIVIAFKNSLASFTPEGDLLYRSDAAPDNATFTSVVVADKLVFVADADNKQVLVYNRNLEYVESFKGESGVSALHGFILPSLHFDMAVNHDNELWVVNPGLHSIQNYSYDGRFRRQWGQPSFEPDGFSGCCNPSYITFLPDGRFVTSEKGLVRIKIYKESGIIESIVAPPEVFKNGLKAPAIANLDDDIVVALDFDKNMIRIFEPK
jgi:hypothetical protein